ncbi:hypothetical protein EDD15DRAFT_2362961 [Pisolithus albus]|nr:hypothetical protein EDD15DRAFT_2362961 [Pisolithus albus]
MELVGPSAAQLHKDGAGTTPMTVIRIVDQAASRTATSNPTTFFCTLDDPSKIKLIDFGISKPFACDKSTAPKEYDPLKEHQHIIGTLYCARLNSHNGEDVGPRDDIESLAFVGLFLPRGNSPWKPRPRTESQLRSQEIVRVVKQLALAQIYPKRIRRAAYLKPFPGKRPASLLRWTQEDAFECG